MPDDYYKDELSFTAPEQLNDMFSKLEEENLCLLMDDQLGEELLSAFEKLSADELMLHYTKEREYSD